MDRGLFIKALIGLPFGGMLVRKLQPEEGEARYLLNRFFVAGFQYYNGPSVIDEIREGEWLKLRAGLDNEYDRFAVEIYRNGAMLGHVPRSDNKHISRLLQQGVSLGCKAAGVNPHGETWEMLKVEVFL